MAKFMCRKCKTEMFDPVEMTNGIHNGCADEPNPHPAKCPVNGNDCPLWIEETEEERIARETEEARLAAMARQRECLDANRERSIRDLMAAARDVLTFLNERRPRMGGGKIEEFAKEYVIGKLDSALEDLDSYDETDDPRANGWVGNDGRP